MKNEPTRVESAPPVSGPKLMPVDDGSSDASFAAFRKDLLEVVRKHDASALLRVVNPKIRTGFGPEGGIEAFRKQWKPEDPQSKLWDELQDILTHGGKFNRLSEQPQFWAPYWYSAWPEAHDAFESVVVIEENVPLHEEKSESSKSIATLSYDIVKRNEEQKPWMRVTTADGRSGWVESRYVRSPIGYRTGFTKKGESWQMDALVAGD